MKQKFLLLAMMLCVMVSCTTEMDDYLSIPNETTLTQEEESIITRAMGCDTYVYSNPRTGIQYIYDRANSILSFG